MEELQAPTMEQMVMQRKRIMEALFATQDRAKILYDAFCKFARHTDDCPADWESNECTCGYWDTMLTIKGMHDERQNKKED